MNNPIIPDWLIEMEYEAGDDLAEFDAFICEGSCGQIFEIDDSYRVADELGGSIYVCGICRMQFTERDIHRKDR